MTDKKTTEMTGEAFLEAVKDAGLTDDLARYMQSEVDKRVAAISEKKESKLLEKIEQLTILLGKNERENLVNEALTEAKLDAKFSKYVAGNTKDEIEASIKNLQSDFLGVKQQEIDSELEKGTLSSVKKSAGNITVSDQKIKDYLGRKDTDKVPTLGVPQTTNSEVK
jgi:hypothetical protein